MRVEEKSIGIFVYKDVLDGKNFIAELEIECSKDNQTFWNKLINIIFSFWNIYILLNNFAFSLYKTNI